MKKMYMIAIFDEFNHELSADYVTVSPEESKNKLNMGCDDETIAEAKDAGYENVRTYLDDLQEVYDIDEDDISEIEDYIYQSWNGGLEDSTTYKELVEVNVADLLKELA